MKIRKVWLYGRPRWRLDYGRSLDGKRTRRFFRSKTEAETARQKGLKEQKLVGTWWASAPDSLKVEGVAVFQEMHQAGFSPRQVWDAFRTGTHAKPKKPLTLIQAVRQTIAAKIAAKRRPTYITGLEDYLLRFVHGREQMDVSQIDTENIEKWFSERKETPITRRGNLGRISSMFNYCVRHGHLDRNPCANVERITVESRPPIILTPKQAEKCLRDIRRHQPQALAYLSLALLAGIRPDEIMRLQWSDVDWKSKTVRIDAAASKVRNRRIVHLMPSAAVWLKEAQKCKCDFRLATRPKRMLLQRLCKVIACEKWPQDLLRHTAASYLLAHHQDVGRVAQELGNSPRVLLSSYQELVTKADAQRFWDITP